MTKNDISQILVSIFSNRVKQLDRSACLDIDSGTCVDRSSCHFSDLAAAFKDREKMTKKVKMIFHICVNFLKTFSS